MALIKKLKFQRWVDVLITILNESEKNGYVLGKDMKTICKIEIGTFIPIKNKFVEFNWLTAKKDGRTVQLTLTDEGKYIAKNLKYVYDKVEKLQEEKKKDGTG